MRSGPAPFPCGAVSVVTSFPSASHRTALAGVGRSFRAALEARTATAPVVEADEREALGRWLGEALGGSSGRRPRPASAGPPERIDEALRSSSAASRGSSPSAPTGTSLVAAWHRGRRGGRRLLNIAPLLRAGRGLAAADIGGRGGCGARRRVPHRAGGGCATGSPALTHTTSSASLARPTRSGRPVQSCTTTPPIPASIFHPGDPGDDLPEARSPDRALRHLPSGADVAFAGLPGTRRRRRRQRQPRGGASRRPARRRRPCGGDGRDRARATLSRAWNDNATAVVLLLAIARRLLAEPTSSLRVILLSTGSEESFSEGIKAFGERHFDSPPRESTFFLCVDTLGSPTLNVLRGEGFGAADAPVPCARRSSSSTTRPCRGDRAPRAGTRASARTPRREARSASASRACRRRGRTSTPAGSDVEVALAERLHALAERLLRSRSRAGSRAATRSGRRAAGGRSRAAGRRRWRCRWRPGRRRGSRSRPSRRRSRRRARRRAEPRARLPVSPAATASAGEASSGHISAGEVSKSSIGTPSRRKIVSGIAGWKIRPEWAASWWATRTIVRSASAGPSSQTTL